MVMVRYTIRVGYGYIYDQCSRIDLGILFLKPNHIQMDSSKGYSPVSVRCLTRHTWNKDNQQILFSPGCKQPLEDNELFVLKSSSFSFDELYINGFSS